VEGMLEERGRSIWRGVCEEHVAIYTRSRGHSPKEKRGASMRGTRHRLGRPRATHCARATYEVGPGAGTYATIGAVPWESLVAGTRGTSMAVRLAYKEKWVIGRQTAPAVADHDHGVPAP